MMIRKPGEEELLAAYQTHRAAFVKTGHPISFGRLEGIKEVAELLKLEWLLAEIQRDVEIHYKDMQRQCA